MKKLWEKCLSYGFINALILIICVLDLAGVTFISSQLMTSNNSSYFLEALKKLAFLPVGYIAFVILNIILLICSLMRWRRNKINKMYLISMIFSALMLLISLRVLPMVRLTVYELMNNQKMVSAMTLSMNEAALMNYLMGLLFAFIISGFIALGMLMMSGVIHYQIKGKLYFPRREGTS